MFRHLRWQIALASAGVLLIALVVLVVSNRAFVDRPARGGQLVEALVGDPRTFNPLLATQPSEVDLVRLLFDGLTRVDADGRIQPALATSWAISPDAKTYTFTLRAGTTWHDGEPVTADDVVLTARLAKDPQLHLAKSRLAQGWADATATAIDSQTVQITLTQASAPFLEATTLGLVPAHILATVPAVNLPEHRFSVLSPIGTGAYQLDLPSGLADNSIRLRRFDGHYAATDGRPYLDQLVFQRYPSAEAALVALGARTVQAMGGVPAEAFTRLGDDARFLSATRAGYTAIYLNAADVLFADPAVRQALSLALDRQAILHDPQGLHDQGVLAVSPIPPGSWAYNGAVPLPAFDPERAQQVLEAANWLDSDANGIRDRDGKPLQFTLTTSNDPLLKSIALRAQANWRSVGVSTTLETVDQQQHFNAAVNRSFQATLYSVDVPLVGYDPDPYALWHSSQIEGGAKLNFAGFSNPEMDGILDQARQTNPADLDRRRTLYQAFQRSFATEQPVLMLYHPAYTYAILDPNLGGVQLPRLIVEPADRFATLADWYTRTERLFSQ